MNQGDWEQLILCYLKDRGYKEAEQALERSVRAHEPDAAMALSDRLSVHKGVVEAMVSTFATSDQPQAYVEALDRFSSWLDNSLDMYRGELSKLLHPLFLHCYLALVAKDAEPVAKTLLAKFQRRLVSVEGPLSRLRDAELSELRGVVHKQHLTSNSFVRQVLSSKQTVRLSGYAHSLLMHFLHSNPGMLCLASIINQYIHIEVSEQPEPVADDDEEEADNQPGGDDTTADRADAEAGNINQQPVSLGLLKGNIEDRYADGLEQKMQDEQKPAAAPAEAAAAAADAAKPAAEEADAAAGEGAPAAAAAAPPAKKAKKEGKAAAGDVAPAQGSVPRLHPGARVEPQPWTPQVTDTVANTWLKDVELRAEVGPSSLPSCCFFTFANTRQTMNCAAFTLAANMVAAGFADSSVRLYDLAAKRKAQGEPTTGRASTSKAAPTTTSTLDADDDNDQQPGVSYLYGHTGPVHAVSFMHDQRLLMSGSADGTVRAWSTDLGTGLAAYRGHLLPIWDVAAGPLGYHFVTGSADRTARVWATDSVRMLRILAGHQADVDVVAWHPNTAYVATASSDRSVRLWDVASGACVRFLTGLASSPTCMAMHPDGKHIAVGSDRGSVLVWELGSARRLASFKAHSGPVWSLAYSRGQGSLLASGGADETVRLWNTQAAQPTSDTAAGPSKVAEGASKAGDGTSKASTSAAGGEAAGSATRKPYSQLLACHTKSSSITHLQFSHRNLLLAAGAFNLRSRKT